MRRRKRSILCTHSNDCKTFVHRRSICEWYLLIQMHKSTLHQWIWLRVLNEFIPIICCWCRNIYLNPWTFLVCCGRVFICRTLLYSMSICCNRECGMHRSRVFLHWVGTYDPAHMIKTSLQTLIDQYSSILSAFRSTNTLACIRHLIITIFQVRKRPNISFYNDLIWLIMTSHHHLDTYRVKNCYSYYWYIRKLITFMWNEMNLISRTN